MSSSFPTMIGSGKNTPKPSPRRSKVMPGASAFSTLRPYGLKAPLKGDISDWLDTGKTAGDLYEIIDRLPEWTPSVPPSEALPLVPPTPAPRPYPLSALGETLSGAAANIASQMPCSPALAAQSVLAVGALAAQRLADVRLPFVQTRPVSLYCVTVAGSSDRKTSADREALIPVRMHEKNLKRSYVLTHEAWRISHVAWAAQHRKIEADKSLERLSREAELSLLGLRHKSRLGRC